MSWLLNLCYSVLNYTFIHALNKEKMIEKNHLKIHHLRLIFITLVQPRNEVICEVTLKNVHFFPSYTASNCNDKYNLKKKLL